MIPAKSKGTCWNASNMAQMQRILTVSLLLSIALSSAAQTSSQKASVQLSATVQVSPPTITLAWTALASTTSITIYRKLKTGTSWGSAIATPGTSSLTYADNTVAVGTAYEYKVVRVAGGVTGSGYIASGIDVPVTDYRGKLILLVDNTISASLTAELNQLQYDLRADGWAVVRSDVSPSATVTSVRTTVIGLYNADPANVKAVYIVGHVPVPYSGNINPDGHGEHLGAWPTDGYYGELNGTWTDNSVNNNGSARAANRNVPNDGKFDQSNFPNAVELQVGRLDLSDLPAFSTNTTELTRNYLNRAHSYKIKGWSPTVRGLMFDNLQWVSNPLAASGWRAMAPLVGAANITNANQNGTDYYLLVNGQSYLWTYSSGGGLQATDAGVLTYNGADGVGTTQGFVTTSPGSVFNMSFGSYFGDWDNRNNYLRAPLAIGQTLTNCWAAIPAWYFHHMGLGDNIGYSTLISMNNSALYTPLTDGWQGSIGRTHLGLMGDPALRMKMVAPPTNLSVTSSSGIASFAWSASSETGLAGYHLYLFDSATGAITRLTTTPVSGTSYLNAAIPFVAGRDYMVRAVKLENNTSGSYFNLSLGSIATAAGVPANDCLGVPGGSALPGTACNDNDPCTTGDVWSASCQCAGTASGDTDGDGICNAQDNCPNLAGQIGSACNDGNACTTGDVINASCQCAGTASGDTDGDGTCNVLDGCPSDPNKIAPGLCGCGVAEGSCQDCLGVPNGTTNPGTACNDGNASTGNDTWNASCQCVGQTIDCLGTPGGTALPGSTCNDNNANTINDVWSANCTCAGTAVVFDCNGVANGTALPGTACNDGNPFTTNDAWNIDCFCVGTLDISDCSGVPGGNAQLDDCGICSGGNTGIQPNADTDSDGLISCQDNCSAVYNPGQADFDNDGIGDYCDNCVWLFNPDQADADSNGQGDVCDISTGLSTVEAKPSFWLQPNPTSGPVHVICTDPAVRSIVFQNGTGELVMRSNLLNRIDVDHLATGVYLVIALDAEGRPLAQTRLVKN